MFMRLIGTFEKFYNTIHWVMFSGIILHKKTMEATIMKKIISEFSNERIIPASGLAVVGAILGKSDFVKRCNRMDVTPEPFTAPDKERGCPAHHGETCL